MSPAARLGDSESPGPLALLFAFSLPILHVSVREMSLGSDSTRDVLPYIPTERKHLLGGLSDELVLVFGIFFPLLTLLLLL